MLASCYPQPGQFVEVSKNIFQMDYQIEDFLQISLKAHFAPNQKNYQYSLQSDLLEPNR